MRNEIGVGMGEVHARAYRRLFDHYPTSVLEPKPVTADDRGTGGPDA